MSYKLNVAKKYDIAWDYNLSAFNHKSEELHYLLVSLGCNVGDDWEEFEVGRNEWNSTIEKLKNLDSLPSQEKQEISKRLKELDEGSAEEVARIMERYENAADPNEDSMLFSFF